MDTSITEQENVGDNNIGVADKQQQNKLQAMENPSTNNDMGGGDNGPDTKTEHSKNESFQCSVEKEVIESENSKIERKKSREQQIVREVKTSVTETVEQLTMEQLFERFPELRGATLDGPSKSTKGDVVEGGDGTFANPKTVKSSKEESTVSASTCPEDKGATLIKISNKSMTRQIVHASSKSNGNGENDPNKDDTFGNITSPITKDPKNHAEAKVGENDDNIANPSTVNAPTNMKVNDGEAERKSNDIVVPSSVDDRKILPEETKDPDSKVTNKQASLKCCSIM